MIAAAALIAACGNLQEQPKLHKPFDASPNFETAARVPLPEAVAVGTLNDDEHFYTGMVDGEFVETFPFEITAEVIAEGRITAVMIHTDGRPMRPIPDVVEQLKPFEYQPPSAPS